MKSSNAIDAVITWVDGNDKEHFKKRQKVLAKETDKKENDLVTGYDETRFEDSGELRFCIRSIRKFAPWINRIYLVTDNQVPSFLTTQAQQKYNVYIVDHRDIFDMHQDVLPTFNSRTIETALWRISGLSSRFIYFNDDFVITRPVKESDFFEGEKVVLRGRWKRIQSYGNFILGVNRMVSSVLKQTLDITRSLHLLYQIRSANITGFRERYFRIEHVPHPVNTQTIQYFFRENPRLFEENIQYRFRNTNQFSAIFVANYLEIKNGNAVLKNPDYYMMMNGEMEFAWSLRKKLNSIKNNEISFICLQGFEKFSKPNRQIIISTLEELLNNDQEGPVHS